MDDTLKQIQKHYGSLAMAVAIAGGLVFILCGYKALGRGLILGTFFSIVNFILMGQSLRSRIGGAKARMTVLSLVSVLLRFALLAVPVIVALSFEPYHLATTIAGLFMVQIVMLLESIKKLIRNKFSVADIGK